MNSDSEDYRSVIDDLTVENKKLKRKLRKYERLLCTHLQQDKLFEVKVHGLSVRQKKELETVLCTFVAGLGRSDGRQPTGAPALGGPQHRPGSVNPQLPYATPVDSAYASNTTSDVTIQPSQPSHSLEQEKTASCGESRHEAVKSYIRDMPRPTLSSRPSGLPENVKRKMIVKRLEQVFTGKSAVRIRPEFTQQQQEVSTSAAMVDNCAKRARGQNALPEGAREARILHVDSETLNNASRSYSRRDGSSDPSINNMDSSKEGTPDQRPTRPMDLDPYRMQDGAENMDYIRHLGLSSPVRHPDVPDDGDGWVYLNLLISMAQLHTFSVTPEFIRKAIADLSSKFEISADGRQVRWRYTTDKVFGKSDSGDGTRSRDSKSSSDQNVNRRGSPAVETSEIKFGALPTKSIVDVSSLKKADTLAYKPLFCHEFQPENNCFDDPDAESPLDLSEGGNVEVVDAAERATCSLDAQKATSTSRNGNGLLIFYKNAAFCTDLSGDMEDSRKFSYGRYTEQPLGHTNNTTGSEEAKPGRSVQPTKGLAIPSGFATDGDSKATSEAGLDFPDLEPLSLHPSNDDVDPIPFEASGLAGVQPEDNFMIDVAMQHPRRKSSTIPISPFSHPRKQVRRIHHKVPSTSVAASTRQGMVAYTTYQSKPAPEIVSSKITDLAPSSLPQPSYICLPFSSSDSDESEESESQNSSDSTLASGTDMMDKSQNSEASEIIPTGHIPPSIAFSRAQSTRTNDEEDEESDDSIDMLAYARRRDPWAVAAEMMAYDADRARSVSTEPANGSASDEHS